MPLEHPVLLLLVHQTHQPPQLLASPYQRLAAALYHLPLEPKVLQGLKTTREEREVQFFKQILCYICFKLYFLYLF